MPGGPKAAWLLLGVGAGVLMAAAWSHWMQGKNGGLFLVVGILALLLAAGALVLGRRRRAPA